MKNIIVTGASKGIGKELVKKFLQLGHNVVGIARTETELQETQHPNYTYIVCDFSNTEEIETVATQLPFKKVDVLINNAGILIKKPFSDLQYQDFEQSFKVNYYAPAKLIQQLETKFNTLAHIVNISTIGAINGSVKFPELSVYGGTKAALVHLTEILAEEWKEKPLSVNCLALGSVQTKMLEQAFPGYQAPVNAKEMAEYIADFALNKAKFYNGKILQVSSSTP